MKRSIFLAGISSLLLFTACKKETETIVTAAISDYAPLTVGKYVTYQLDSLVLQNFGASITTVSYQVKHEVSEQVTDNLERPAYRITRYIRKTAQAAWIPDNTFTYVNTEGSLEFIENNMRFIKLRLPIKDGFSWKGNNYIDTYSFNSSVKYLDDWDYVYDSTGVARTIGSFNLDSTIKVAQRDETINNPSDPTNYFEENYGEEIYAKGIGLVYRRFLHTEFQPATPGNLAAYDDKTYGITLTMIDHN